MADANDGSISLSSSEYRCHLSMNISCFVLFSFATVASRCTHTSSGSIMADMISRLKRNLTSMPTALGPRRSDQKYKIQTIADHLTDELSVLPWRWASRKSWSTSIPMNAGSDCAR